MALLPQVGVDGGLYLDALHIALDGRVWRSAEANEGLASAQAEQGLCADRMGAHVAKGEKRYLQG